MPCELKSLRQYPSDAEVEKTIAENEEKIAEKDEALDKIKNGCNISVDDMAKTSKEFEKLFKTWKKCNFYFLKQETFSRGLFPKIKNNLLFSVKCFDVCFKTREW